MKNNRNILFSVVLVHFLMMNVAYQLLAIYFEFPDVLRFKTIDMFNLFLKNQTIVRPAYYLFTLTGITFFTIAFFIYESFEKKTTLGRLSMAFGCLAGLLTSFGFIRWVFVIPEMANSYIENQGLESINMIIESNIKLIHSYSGVALGENLAFLFQGLWLFTLSFDLLSSQTKDKKLFIPPMLIGVGIMIYSLEQFGGVFSHLAVINIPLQASWLVWLMSLAWSLKKSEERNGVQLSGRETAFFSLLLLIIMLTI